MKSYKTRELTTTDAGTTVTVVSAGIGHELGYVNIIKDTAHVITFYDGPAATGDKIFTKPASSTAGHYKFDRPVTKGLYAVVAASFAGNIVVGFN